MHIPFIEALKIWIFLTSVDFLFFFFFHQNPHHRSNIICYMLRVKIIMKILLSNLEIKSSKSIIIHLSWTMNQLIMSVKISRLNFSHQPDRKASIFSNPSVAVDLPKTSEVPRNRVTSAPMRPTPAVYIWALVASHRLNPGKPNKMLEITRKIHCDASHTLEKLGYQQPTRFVLTTYI